MTFNDTLKRFKVQLLLAIPLLAVLYYRIVPDMVMDWYTGRQLFPRFPGTDHCRLFSLAALALSER